MIDRYTEIKKRLVTYAEQDEAIQAIVAIGSSTRVDVPADEFSDLDLIITTTDPERWYSNEYPKKLGDARISFIEWTLGGGKERRAIYNDDMDVDMIIFTPEQFDAALREGVAAWVMNRGYNILYDNQDWTALIHEFVPLEVHAPSMEEEEFINMVNDFYFHNIWAGKKVLRGELWSAKISIDSYLKNYLLKVIELYCHQKHGVDTWHDGRFIDRWADPFIKEALPGCFAAYDPAAMLSALANTHHLFAQLAREVAGALDYGYPEEAEACAKEFLLSADRRK